jgi:PAS domain S-box-containing protein
MLREKKSTRSRRARARFPSLAALIFLGGFLLLNPSGVSARKTLRVGVPLSLPPFSFIDEDTGRVRGFCVDLALILGRQINANVELQAMEPSSLKEALKRHTIDLISCIALAKKKDPDFSPIETDIMITRHYFASKACVTVTCHRDLPGHTVAVVNESDHLDVDQDRKDITFRYVSSPLEAVKLLDLGKADVYIAYSDLSTLYLIQKYKLQSVKKVGVPVESLPLSMVVPRDTPELLKELSVAYGKILESGDYNQIREKWLGKGVQFEYWQKYIKVLGLIAVLILGGVLVLLAWNRMLQLRVGQTTKDLQLTEGRYRHLIESSPEMILLISEDGKIIQANQLALTSLGYTEDNIMSHKLSDLMIDDQRKNMEDFVRDLSRDGFASAESVFESGTGDSINVEIIGSLVRGSNTETKLACCFARDITQRKQLEEELIQSERLATIGRMAAGLAHEINNPLGIVLANAQDMLHGGVDHADMLDNLRTIERNAVRASRIVNNLLSYTRPTPFNPVSLDLAALIDECLFSLKQPLKKQGIQVKKELTDSSLVFEGDENMIQQLLLNLLLNAIEAIHDQGTITIRAGRENSGGSAKIHLQIEDSGTGIAEGDLKKIFDPFFTARKKKGFGLGLFVSKRIVDKHGGTILARSEQGKGAVVTVVFPAQSALSSWEVVG